MSTVNLESVIKVLTDQSRREQDLSILERDKAYFAHAVNHVMLLGAIQFVTLLREKGATLQMDEQTAKELGFDVAS